MTPKRLLGIGLRLSVVVGIVMGLYSAWNEAVRASESKASADRIWSGLLCAARFDNAALERVRHPLGNYDISKLGCGHGSGPDGAFLANAPEIDQARRNDHSGMEYTTPFNSAVPVTEAIRAFITVNLATGLIALAWVVGRWVIAGG
jgi:hypothetical protein